MAKTIIFRGSVYSSEEYGQLLREAVPPLDSPAHNEVLVRFVAETRRRLESEFSILIRGHDLSALREFVALEMRQYADPAVPGEPNPLELSYGYILAHCGIDYLMLEKNGMSQPEIRQHVRRSFNV